MLWTIDVIEGVVVYKAYQQGLWFKGHGCYCSVAKRDYELMTFDANVKMEGVESFFTSYLFREERDTGTSMA